MELILGRHSIVECIKNPLRQNLTLHIENSSLSKLKSEFATELLSKISIHKYEKSNFQNTFDKLCSKYDLKKTQRSIGNMALEAEPLPVWQSYQLESELLKLQEKKKRPLKLICLDQVSDIENAGGILRSAAFFGVDACLVSQKGSFSLNPAFYRKACGAREHVILIQSSKSIQS